MGWPTGSDHHAAMDEINLRSRNVPAIRSFRICLDHPQRQKTILEIVRRHAEGATPRRPVALPRRTHAFA
jgi:hypothetical protein